MCFVYTYFFKFNLICIVVNNKLLVLVLYCNMVILCAAKKTIPGGFNKHYTPGWDDSSGCNHFLRERLQATTKKTPTPRSSSPRTWERQGKSPASRTLWADTLYLLKGKDVVSQPVKVCIPSTECVLSLVSYTSG